VTPFTRIEAVVAPMLRANIDTDQIIPSREMKTTGKTGLAAGLFAGWRYLDTAARTPDPAFVLNRPEYAGAAILLAGANFGAGSSREHAVWALGEYGIRAVIAQRFSTIFEANAVRNGLLPVRLDAAEVARIADWIAVDPRARRVTIDLPAQTVTADAVHPFAIREEAKAMLVGGLDAIDLTRRRAPEIAAWTVADRAARPWIYATAHG